MPNEDEELWGDKEQAWQKGPKSDFLKGYYQGLKEGYDMAWGDFQNGVRAIWMKNESGDWFIAQKVFHTDPDYAEATGVNAKANGAEFKLTPEQAQRLNNEVRSIIQEYANDHPEHSGEIHFNVLLLTDGTKTANWGIVKSLKLLIIKGQYPVNHPIPGEAIVYYNDYDL